MELIGNILLWIGLILLIPTAYAAVIGAPIAITSKSRIKEIIEKSSIAKGGKFYELGTGNGRVISAVGKLPGVEVFGFELSPIFYAISYLNLLFSGVENFWLKMSNFFNADLSDADYVFFFLMPAAVEKLKDKLEKELKPGAIVISFVFEIKGWDPYEVIEGDKKPPVYFYTIK